MFNKNQIRSEKDDDREQGMDKCCRRQVGLPYCVGVGPHAFLIFPTIGYLGVKGNLQILDTQRNRNSLGASSTYFFW